MPRLARAPARLPACSPRRAAATTRRRRRRRRRRPSATATPEDTGGEQGTGCEPVAEPEPQAGARSRSRSERLDPAKTYVATVETNCGDFEITLDAERAPKTGGSFKSLADKGFFDGLGFHRIVPGFVIQGGDPQGNGGGGPGYSDRRGAAARTSTYDKGVVAMAKTAIEEPGTSGSQFFVVTGDGTPLRAATTRCSARSRRARTSST